jgi:hypothetical protein
MLKRWVGALGLCILFHFIEPGHSFYLPGVAPRKYVHGEQLMVKVNTLTSELTPLQVWSATLTFS